MGKHIVKWSNHNISFSNVEVKVLLAGFGKTSYLKSRAKGQGGCARFWRAEKRLRFAIRHMIKTQWFYWSVIVLVLFNTICVAVEFHGQPQFLTDFLCK